MSKLPECLSKKIEKEVPVIISSKTVCPVSESTTRIFVFFNEELKLKTTYDEENIVSEDTIDRKSKWDDFVKGYDEEDEEPKTNKKKHGKRFL